MKLQFLIYLWVLSSPLLLHAQQPYIRKATTDCGSTDNSTSIFGYTCNGQTPNCQSYLVFRSQPPYNTVSTISTLLASDATQLSEINAVSVNSTFETNKEVIVPVNCSCSGDHYQANSSYVTQRENNYFDIANNTFQGLSTCQALQNQNTYASTSLPTGIRITVPLRCACPTKNQTDEGINYLLSYLITWGNDVYSISQRFNVDMNSTLKANEISAEDPTIYPFTTLLIPLQNPPTSRSMAPSPPPPSTPSPPPSSQSPPTPPAKKKDTKWIIIIVVAVVATGTLVSVVSIIIFCVFFRRVRNKAIPDSPAQPILDSGSFISYDTASGKPIEDSEEFLDSVSDIAQSLRVYKFEELQLATENFSLKYWVKGSVYRGTISGNLVAIKKTNKDIVKELDILKKIHHSNLIKLSGVCFREGYWYLVFEYAMNGSLSDWIYQSTNSKKSLSWSERIQIALDVASGLNYLHSYTNPPHVHKDVKTSNVLLDSDFRAKLTNFSLATSADGVGGEFQLTRHIVGTKGYMAPEYLEHGYVSPKLDVYSFGIVILEMLTGKETAIGSGAGNLCLPKSLTAILDDENPKEKLKDFVDPSLQGQFPLDLALLLARLIESCLRRDPAGRPVMGQVVHTLSTISASSLNKEVSDNASLNESWETATDG